MTSAPHEVYSKCLPGAHGYPLWTPELKIQLRENYQLEGLKIGDVGIVSPNDGSFDVLFNITLPHSEQPYPRLVREDFTPIILDPEADFATQPRAVSAHGVISSESVELISQEIHNCDQRPSRYVAYPWDSEDSEIDRSCSRANYEFGLSLEDGAVLILPEGAQSCDLVNEKRFLDEAIRHGINWYACATERAGRLINNDSLYLITGFHKTRSWSLGAAGRSSSSLQNRRSVKFKVEQIHQHSDPAAAYIWSAAHGFTGRVGPMSDTPDRALDGRFRRAANQAVFIRGFRITVNKLLFLKTVSVETRQGTFGGLGTYVNSLLWGRPSDSTQSAGTGSATDNTVDQDSSENHGRLYTGSHLTIDRMQDVSQTFHPGDSINQYMLKMEPRAMIALTHDSLWIEMLRMGLLELADFSHEQRLEEVLSNNYRLIVEDGAVCLQKGHAFENLPHQPSGWKSRSSSLTGSVPTPGVSDLHPKRAEEEQAEDEALAPGDPQRHVSAPSSSATHTDTDDETIISGIRVTGFALAPTGFYTVVRHSGLEWRTENKRSSTNDDAVEWRWPIPIPSDPSAIICLEIYTSSESQRMLGAGERLGELTITVQQLLAHSEKDIPFTFSPKGKDVVSPSSSILVTCAQGWDGGDDQVSIIESITAEQDAAATRISDILGAVRRERAEMERERESLAAEHERERARLDEARKVKVTALEVELARTRAELDKERQLRMSESKGPRLDKASRNQQVSPTNTTQPDQVLHQEKGAPMEEHWAEKRRWEERDGQMQELMEMISRLLDEQAAARQREEEQRQAGGGKAGIEKVMELLNTLSNDSTQKHEETINTVRATANEQVPYNIQRYLDEFSKALATEVRTMLGEIGRLHEERLSIQHELGYLMTMKSKYGPGGEFGPESKSRMTFSALPPQFPPPPIIPPPPPPEDMPPPRPPWRTVPQRSSRRSRKMQETPPEPVPGRQVHSWVTWQPNPAPSSAPPPVEPAQPLPNRGSLRLFGHTNRRDDSSPEPVPSPRRYSGVTWPLQSPTPSPSESSSPEPILLDPECGSPGLFGPRSPRESD